MKKRNGRVWIPGIFVLADIVLSWVLFYICDGWLGNIMGPDIIEYENRFGTLDNPIRYRFGIGSAEILIALLQLIMFVSLELMLNKKKYVFKVYTYVATVFHVLNFLRWVLLYIEWNAWIDIPEFILPQYRVIELFF